MDSQERSGAGPHIPPARDAFPQSDPAGTSPERPTRRRRRGSLLRRLAGHSGRILLLWLVVSTPIGYVIYLLVEPTYEAFSLLQVEPATEFLFTLSSRDIPEMRAYEPYVQTQVQLITCDQVLDAALARDPRIAKLPMIKNSEDPKADLRAAMVVGVVDKHTYLIKVALASPDPEEAAMIVNAVVDAYMDLHTKYHRSANMLLHKRLDEENKKLTKEIQEKQDALAKLVASGNVRVASIQVPKPVKRDAANKDDPQIPSLAVVSEEQYAQVAGWLIHADRELIDARVKLEIARRAQKSVESKSKGQPGAARATAEEKIRELEAAVDEVEEKRIGYMRYLESVNVQSRANHGDTLRATIVTQELTSLQKMKDIINQKLEQLSFEEKQDVYRITLHDRAGVPKAPANNKRLEYMAAAPVGVLLLLIGCFLMLEVVKGEPVASPADQEPMPLDEWDA